jgi:hypothetical protein
LRAGECADEGHFPVGEYAQHRVGCWRADIAEKWQNLFVLDQFYVVGIGAIRRIAIVKRNKSDLAAVDTARLVDDLEIRFRPLLHFLATRFCRAGKGGRLADENRIAGDASREGLCTERQCYRSGHYAAHHGALMPSLVN